MKIHKRWSTEPDTCSQICRYHYSSGRKWGATKEPLDEGERRQWKIWLKTQHSKNKDHGICSRQFTANRWGNNGNWDFIFLGSKITLDSDCSHEIKRHLLLGRKAMTNIDSVLKTRHHFANKVHIVKAMVFPVVMYGCERRLSAEELMLSNCSAGDDSWKSLGKQGDLTSQS